MKNTFRILLPLLIIFLGIYPVVAKSSLTSGSPIPTVMPGPLSTDAVLNIPLGAAFVYQSEQPDLFVRTGRFGTEIGLFLFPWCRTNSGGVPVFGHPVPIKHPFEAKNPPTGSLVQTPDGQIHAIWLAGMELVHTRFDSANFAFREISRISLPDLPRAPRNLAALVNSDNSAEILLEIPDGVIGRPTDFSGRNSRYRPYDGAGIWRGGLPYAFLYAVTLPEFFSGSAENSRRISATNREVQISFQQLTVVNFGAGRNRDLVGGSHYGGLHYYHNLSRSHVEFAPSVHLVAPNENAHRHPIIKASPVAFPNPATGLSDLIAGGEGALYFYRFSGKFTRAGKPIFVAPKVVLQENSDLYAGTLPVPNGVDWDGDGDLDIICGNSEGRVLFFENSGTNAEPAFLNGRPLRAGGREIHVQPGYRLDIQGPAEARWGYTCPTVADWNGDGLPDILMSDATARHTLFLNGGTKTRPELRHGHPLYLDGLDLHGTWRVKPAVARLGEKMAYIALDDDDQFHLYWQVDDYNLADGGKLRLADSSVIGANFLHAGGTGRLKLNLTDWDRDEVIDLLVGTPRHGSVPNPETGLPQSLGLPGAAILFLKNTGTNEAPIFAFPELVTFRGKPVFLGQHACAPAPVHFSANGPDLIVGEESGRLLFFQRKDLGTAEPEW